MKSQKTTRPPETLFNNIYRGIVRINDDDPKLAGRIRVQVYPIHSGITDYTTLPLCTSVDHTSGDHNTGSIAIPEVGSHVYVFFENSDHRYPVFLGSAPAIQNDVADAPLAFQGTNDDLIADINAKSSKGVVEASGSTWDESQSHNTTVYPNNKVYRSNNGILIEIDDTPDNTRIHIYHPSNTRTEIDNDGNKVEHVQATKTTVIIGDEFTNVKKDSSKTIEGKKQEYVLGSNEIKIDGNNKITIGNGSDITITGDSTLNVSGSETNTIGASLTINVSDDTTLASPVVQINGDVTTTGTVTLDDGTGKIVTTNHICAFTGNPHPFGSSTCKAKT